MKSVGVCVLAAAAAMSWTGGVRAGNQSPAARSQPAFFAATAAATARPTTLEQREERRFLKDAAAASRFEGEASRIALGKSNHPGVRSFAATLINHHAAATTTLQHLLHVRGMAPPMLDSEQRKTLNRLAKLQGLKFDREFINEVGLKAQQQNVEFYEKAATSVHDPALKAWIAKAVPTLSYHLVTAERVALPEVKPAKATAPGKAAPKPPTARSHRQTATAPAAGTRSVPKASLATRYMGAAPAQRGMQQPGGTLQLGATKPVASRPIEANSP